MTRSPQNPASETTRDGDFYNEVVHERVVSDIEDETTIVDVCGSVSWEYYVKVGWKSLRETKTLRARSIEDIKEYAQMTDKELGSKVKYGRKNASRRHTWTARNCRVNTKITTHLKLERPDGDTVWVTHEEKTSKFKCETAVLARAYYRKKPLTLDRLDEGYELHVDGETLTVRDSSRRKEDETHDQLFAYLSSGDLFVQGHIEKVRDDGSRMFIDVKVKGETFTFTFESPKSSTSELWDVVDSIGAGNDPLSVENESVTVAYFAFSSKDGLVEDAPWVLARESQSEGLLSRIVRKLRAF